MSNPNPPKSLFKKGDFNFLDKLILQISDALILATKHWPDTGLTTVKQETRGD
jgi:hypothetical protein